MPESADMLKAVEAAVVENGKKIDGIAEVLDQLLSVLENIERNTRK
jgi:hypothetical protein